MVCPLGGGRMEALARLRVAGSVQQTASEEVGHHKLAAQYIHRELREADEANLIDEEDMHVFGLRPLIDPLHLVCCNACKKPIKASQYVAHSELCKSLNSTEEIVLEVDGGTGHKKRPKKERKKSLTAYSNQSVSVRKQTKLDNGFAGSPCYSEEHLRTVSFPEAKRIASHINVATPTDSPIISPGLRDCSEGAISHQKKHSKMLMAGNHQLSADIGAANAVKKSWCANSRIAFPCAEHQERSTAGGDNAYSHAVAREFPTQVQKNCSMAEDIPRPLATKMYYSQRNHRLRSALRYIYHEASCNDSGSEFACPKVSKSNVMPGDMLSYDNNSQIQVDQQEKAHDDSVPLVQKSNLLQMVDSGGCPPPMNIASQFTLNNGLTYSSVGMMQSNYKSNSYSYSGHSGKQLQNIQQAEGNFAVVQNS